MTAGDDVFDLNQDVDSDHEIEGSSKVVIRESSNFKAEVVNKTIRLVLSEYDIEMTQAIMEKKFVCIIADSASVNRRSARLLGVPFVNCLMHAFNLSIRALTNENSHAYDEALHKVIEEASRLARHFKNLKNGTCLRQLTPLVPKLACPTRWSGNLDAVVRYDRLRTCYKEAMNNPDCGYIEMNEGEEWDFIVSSKKKLLKSIGNNMKAIQSSN